MRRPFVLKDGAVRVTYRMDGRRKTVHLGKGVALSYADKVQKVLDELVSVRAGNTFLCRESLDFLRHFPHCVKESLQRQGLFDFNRIREITLLELRDTVLASGYSEVKKTAIRYAFSHFFECFESGRIAEQISPSELEDFAFYLGNTRTRKLAEYTIHTTFRWLRYSYKVLQERDMIFVNPFSKVRAGSERGVPSVYVERTGISELLKKCDHEELKLAVMLARFAGLRIPCEILNLKWSDIGVKFFMVIGKTGSRSVPLFREVREAFKNHKRKDEYVFPELRRHNRNWLYGLFCHFLKEQGMKRWIKLFNSLRASCITDYEHEGVHEKTLNSVFGNSSKIRNKYYVKVRRQDLENLFKIRFDSGSPGNIDSEPKHLEELRSILPLLSLEDVIDLWRDCRSSNSNAE